MLVPNETPTWYQLQSDGSCAFRTYSGALLVLIVVGALYWCCSSTDFSAPVGGGAAGAVRAAQRRPPPPTHETYISNGPSESGSPIGVLPSGTWRGYYTFSGARHDVCEFELSFSGDGEIIGSGTDDVGQYRIQGKHGGSRMAFSKTYAARTTNTMGVVSFGNKGHTVEYRGELAGASLGSGFRGAWCIRASLGDHDGDFHLWPAMPDWTAPEAEEDLGDAPATNEDNECVVCYDRAIATRLRPCGHVALCTLCASRLNPRRCPLCRQDIASVETYAPSSRSGSTRRWVPDEAASVEADAPPARRRRLR
eukprot:TRINITY_DN11189_c0_g1_i1.p1 TRINITY_DN11189_c0_g1~~TRINITY_DN11189_c0_g1_i1.p1  ORF type:complete len:309 (-),score=42.34 TRINITY_DN11189_c0_g1_i1:188-1114(-)